MSTLHNSHHHCVNPIKWKPLTKDKVRQISNKILHTFNNEQNMSRERIYTK